MRFKLSDHAQERVKERGIDVEDIYRVLESPDNVLEGKFGRKIYQKVIGRYLVRVIVDGNTFITAYRTSKVGKYRR